MMNLTVPVSSMIMMGVSLVASILIPLILFLFFWKKYKCKPMAFVVGMVIMFVFAFTLEQILHMAVLSSGIGSVITGNIWLYGLYGGLAAGVFEETGRFVAFKWILKKHRGDDHTALMYGAGHGGFEAAYILGMGMLSNLSLAMLMNAGATELLFVGVPTSEVATLEAALVTLAETPAPVYLVGIVERLAAVIAHLALSVFVWFAVKKNFLFYPLAILMHGFLDFVVVVVNSLSGNILLVEVLCWGIALTFVFFAVKLWRREHTVSLNAPAHADSMAEMPVAQDSADIEG